MGHILISEMLKREKKMCVLAPLMVLVTNACPFRKTTYFYHSGGGQSRSCGGQPSLPCFPRKAPGCPGLGVLWGVNPVPLLLLTFLSGEERQGMKLSALRAIGQEVLKVALPTGLAPGHFPSTAKVSRASAAQVTGLGPQGGLTVPSALQDAIP